MDCIDQDTLYWIFSTVAQTYGAIVGVVGMLVVYRLQNLNNAMNFRFDSLISRTPGLFKAVLNTYSGPTDFYNNWDEYFKNNKKFVGDYAPEGEIINQEYIKIGEHISVKKIIISKFKIFLIIHLTIIIISILALFFCNILEAYGLLILIISVFILAISVFSISRMIMVVIKT